MPDVYLTPFFSLFLSCVTDLKVFTSMDHTLVLNVFTSGAEADSAILSSEKDREAILKYAADIQVCVQYVGIEPSW